MPATLRQDRGAQVAGAGVAIAQHTHGRTAFASSIGTQLNGRIPARRLRNQSLRTPHAVQAAPLQELERVRLLAEIRQDGVAFSIGQEGTVVHRYTSGEAFEVEFGGTEPAVVTVRRGDIQRVG